MTQSHYDLPTKVNWERFEVACKIAQQGRDGLLTVLLTGKGEPLWFPKLLEKYLTKLRQHESFPLIDLQTNGILFDPHINNNLVQRLDDWRIFGKLTLVCISIAHDNPTINNQLMRGNDHYDYRRAVNIIHNHGLAVRLNVTLTNSGIHTTEDLERIVDLAQELSIEQLTFREVAVPSNPTDVKIATATEKEIPYGASKRLFHYLELNGADRLPNLAHGALVFDYRGQNVSVNHCLTDTLDSNDIRQLIFFPGGEITYDWKYAGARLL